MFRGIGQAPRAETAVHYITMAFDEDLDAAEQAALLDMLTWMHRLTGVARADLYRTASLAADMHVTQVNLIPRRHPHYTPRTRLTNPSYTRHTPH